MKTVETTITELRRKAKQNNSDATQRTQLMQDDSIDFAMMPNEPFQTVQGWFYEMEGAAQACVHRYCELAEVVVSAFKQVGTPCLDDHLLPPEALVSKGVLSSIWSQAVLKCLYMTRLARPELYWAVKSLAREVTRWTVACDKRLRSLMSLTLYDKHSVTKSWTGNKASECKFMLLYDASFAGDLKDSKSTPGPLLCLVGTRTSCPITQMCKKQRAISHSSIEAETISLYVGLRLDGLPAMSLWGFIFNVLEPLSETSIVSSDVETAARANHIQHSPPEARELLNVDYVPTNVPELSSRCSSTPTMRVKFKMCVKVRAPTMRHVQQNSPS